VKVADKSDTSTNNNFLVFPTVLDFGYYTGNLLCSQLYHYSVFLLVWYIYSYKKTIKKLLCTIKGHHNIVYVRMTLVNITPNISIGKMELGNV
jgi:hypothetical protein